MPYSITRSSLTDMSHAMPPIRPEEGKRAEVAAMFDRIAPRYDLLNRVLSLGIDVTWRKAAVRTLRRRLSGRHPDELLDVATGTADLAIELLKLEPARVVGLDPSVGMLELGLQKITSKGLDHRIELIEGASEELPLPANRFSGATVAFGVRNFEDLDAGLREINRVLIPGAPLVVLEFSRPQGAIFGPLFSFYFGKVLPRIGRVVSGDASAYTYLPESVASFPDGEAFLKVMEGAGFVSTERRKLTFGIATLYSGLASA